MEKIDIKSFTFDELQCIILDMGIAKFRAKQIFDWLHIKKVLSFDEMLNLPVELRENLSKNFYIINLKVKNKLVSQIDGTIKFLFETFDGKYLETVLMRYAHGNSLCVSTQIGCKMGCLFCASTKSGFERNLTPSEILHQIYSVELEIKEKISNVVLMGIGEPLDNYDNVIKFLKVLSDKNGHNLSLRHVSLSTCGVVDKIYDLAKNKFGLTLSISLHAPNDEIRSKSMPINEKWKMNDLLKACDYYTKETGRRISYEYALIKGVNDDINSGNQLIKLFRGKLCHINLIPLNNIKENNLQKTDKKQAYKFQQYLNKNGINATIRRTLGSDINAACGQLRRDNIANKEV